MRINDESKDGSARAEHPPTGSRAWRFALSAVLLALGGWAYWPTLARVFNTWLTSPDYSHGFLVLPAALCFLWSRRASRPAPSPTMHWEALLLFGLAGGVRLLAGRYYLPELDAWSIPVWIGGVVLLVFGRGTFRWAAPSIAFLWFATPLPATLEIGLSTPLQKLAAFLSAWSLRFFGQPAFAEGTTILLGNHVLDVERACSGLRMFYGVFALAVASVILTRPSRKKAALILAVAAPIAFITNVARICVTGVLLQNVSGEAARKFSHDIAGLVMLPLAVALFFLLIATMNSMSRRIERDRPRAIASMLRWGGALAILLAAGVVWGASQNQRALETLLLAANRYEREEDWSNATAYLTLYLQGRPDDDDSFVRLAENHRRAATSRSDKIRAIAVLRSAWERAPQRVDLADRAIETAIELRDFRSAIRLCDQVLKSADDTTMQTRMISSRADALLEILNESDSPEFYSWRQVADGLDAARRQSNQSRYAVAVAKVYREKLTDADAPDRIDYANRVLDDLVAEHGDDPMAWLARYQYRRTYSDSLVARSDALLDSDLRNALERIDAADAHDQSEINLAAAAHAAMSGDAASAEAHFHAAIKLAPTDYRAYVRLAELLRDRDEPESMQTAIKVLQDGKQATGGNDVSILMPLASLLAESGQLDAARDSLAKLEESIPRFEPSSRPALILGAGLIRAQILSKSESDSAAIRHIQAILIEPEIHARRESMPGLFAEAHLLLGTLHSRIHSYDQAAEHYRVAARLRPEDEVARASAANSALRAGDLDNAAHAFQELLEIAPNNHEAWVALVGIEIRRELRRSEKARTWTEARSALNVAREHQVPELSLVLLQIDLSSAQGDLESARSMVTDAIEAAPNEPALWRARVLLHEREGDIDASLAAAAKYVELASDEIDASVLHATLLAKAHRVDDAERVLEALRAHATASNRVEIVLETARLRLLVGHVEEAEAHLEDALSETPDQLVILNQLANLAWIRSEMARLEKLEQRLRDVEGEAGTLWRLYRANRLLATISNDDDPALIETHQLADTIFDRRPRWTKSLFLRGDLATRMGRIDTAIDAYQDAWRLGDRSVLLADRLIDLLSQRGRLIEAQSYVAQVTEYLALSTRLFDRAASLFISDGNAEEAVRLAEAWVEQRPNDADARLRLGRVLLMALSQSPANEDAILRKAERAFDAAIRLAPTDVRTWVSSALFHATAEGSEEKAIAVMCRLAEQVAINEFEKSYVLAQLHDIMRRPLDARQNYAAAVRLATRHEPASIQSQVLAQAARFNLPYAPAFAEQFARSAVRIDPISNSAKGVLLDVLSRRDDRASINEALRLLDENMQLDDAGDERYYRSVRARLYAKRGEDGDRAAAIGLLETSLQRSPDDRLLLAALHERDGRIGPAFELLSEAIRERDPRPQDDAAFLQFWQKHFLVGPDESTSPRFSSRAKLVYARLLASPDRLGEYLRWKIRESRILHRTDATTWERIKPMIDVASEKIRNNDSISEESKNAARLMLVAMIEEGADIAARQFVETPHEWISATDAAVAYCHALILTQDVQASDDDANALLREISDTYDRDAALAQSIGDYLFMTNQNDDAVAAYRRALTIDPDRLLARNNLALALAESNDSADEARAVLQDALDQHADDPVLLDTQAIIAIINQQPNEAMKSLDRAVAANPTDAVIRLHAAMGHDALGEHALASERYIEATYLGIENEILSPRDRAFLAKMRHRGDGVGHEARDNEVASSPSITLPVVNN